MKKFLIALVSPVSLMMCVAAGAANAQARIDWGKIAGEWRGRGYIKEAPSSPKESGVCRFQATSSNSNALTLIGRCANTSQSVRIETRLQRGQGGRIDAVSSASHMKADVRLVGREARNRISLRSATPIKIKGKDYSLEVQIIVGDQNRSFTKIQKVRHLGSGKITELFRMQFRKR